MASKKKIVRDFLILFKTFPGLQTSCTHTEKTHVLSPKCGQTLTAALQNAFLSPWNAANPEKQQSLTTNQAVWKTIQQIARLWRRNPTTHGDGSTKTPNVLLLLLQLRGLGQQMRNEGYQAEQCGGPSAPQHMQQVVAMLSVSITHHPLFPSSPRCHHSAIFFFLDEAKHNTLPGEIWPQFAC